MTYPLKCPKCGHMRMERIGNWEACERKQCGYQSVCDSCTSEAEMERHAAARAEYGPLVGHPGYRGVDEGEVGWWKT